MDHHKVYSTSPGTPVSIAAVSPSNSSTLPRHDIQEGSAFGITHVEAEGVGPTKDDPSSSSEVAEHGIEPVPPHLSTTSANTTSDGGIKAWTTILGTWLILFATLGYVYSFGVFQDSYTRFLLSTHSPSTISWIGSFQLMMPFFLGAISGKLFDAGYFYAVERLGSAIFTVSLFLLSLVKPQQYYQVFLSQGIGLGLGLGLTFVPTVSIVVHHFKKRKALATGIALTGGAMGSVVFPIMINHLIPAVGFKKAVQGSAYVVLGCLVVGNCLVRAKYPIKSLPKEGQNPVSRRLSYRLDAPFLWTVLGAFTSNLGIFFPIIYLQLYAIQHDIDPVLSFYSISIINGMGAFGRVGGNFLADKWGPINLFVPCTAINSALMFAVLGVKTRAALIAFSVIFGLFSGAWLSLSISSLASLSRPNEVGARTGFALAIGSFGALGAAPAQGALLTTHFIWHKPIIFSGIVLGVSAFCFFITRTMVSLERGTQKV